MKLPKLSSRQRITLRIVAALVLIWAIVGVLSLRIITNSLSNRIDDELRSEAASGAAAFDLFPPELLDRIDDSDDVGVRQSALIIVGPDGVVTELPSGDSDRPDPLPDLRGASVAELRGRSGDPFTVDGQVIGNQGGVAEPTAHFQAANCADLGFGPKLNLKLLLRVAKLLQKKAEWKRKAQLKLRLLVFLTKS